ncbi:dimethylaniline monooxygenase [Dothidotthia symphoricarpi CBS 119687]|uniref:Dimethylaniline monooxygenase n=1 Tax=Dothidotthia symphoricarpi CBS 119687 TaxID=1392245 RepID=A0A6A6A3A3_9PLEO|nr:dimethylaniline monooxygenase [Dothidotthia symphoricarpi CBS 119687]KAF2125238.1 dimethylaniline monooxygenase [Dothidotthia symphoricarpi CBS 119687]
MGVRRVAVIGLGPGGAIAVDALARERAFDVIRVFERRASPGGCWIEDEAPPPPFDHTIFASLATRTADAPLETPTRLPIRLPKSKQTRHTESSVYPYLETNVDSIPMSFSQEPISDQRSPTSIAKHGIDTPFRHHSTIREYIASLVNRKGYGEFVSYNTTVELAEKVGNEWRLVLRREGSFAEDDEWWEEMFDGVVVANGHYSVPYIPKVEGLEKFEWTRPGSVKHSKMFRGKEAYRDKRIVIVGASVSAADIAYDLVGTANDPIYAVILGHKANGYFGDEAFKNPGIVAKPSISHIMDDRTVHFIDGTSVANVDELIFGTGYSWSLPFLPHVEVRNNRVPNLYQHVVYQSDTTLLFVGAVGAGLTFKVFEWQAVLAARVLAGRAKLPPLLERQQWERERTERLGDGAMFTFVFPDFEEYFETLRHLAGDDGPGRKLPKFEKQWLDVFMAGHEMRKKWWREENAKARQMYIEDSKARL